MDHKHIIMLPLSNNMQQILYNRRVTSQKDRMIFCSLISIMSIYLLGKRAGAYSEEWMLNNIKQFYLLLINPQNAFSTMILMLLYVLPITH